MFVWVCGEKLCAGFTRSTTSFVDFVFHNDFVRPVFNILTACMFFGRHSESLFQEKVLLMQLLLWLHVFKIIRK